jgi:D-methionine transport system ATP-binding protein
LGGQQFGHLRVQLAENADVDAVMRYLHDRGIAAKRAAPAAAAAPEFPDSGTDLPDSGAPLPNSVLLRGEQGGIS